MFKIFFYLNLIFVFLMNQQKVLAFQPATENNYVLAGHVHHTIYAPDWLSCIEACQDDPRCTSYNYERSATANGLCELNDSGLQNLSDKDKSLIYSPGFVFQQIREGKMLPDSIVRKAKKPSPTIYFIRYENVTFPQKGVSDYVIVNTSMPSLSALTACFWMNSTDTVNEGTPLSYAVPAENNEFIVYNYKSFQLYVGGDMTSKTPISANDGRWHHICTTWENTAGTWKLYKDGAVVNQGKKLKKDHVIRGAGALVLGQEQDSVGDKFQGHQSFVGEMTGVNIWSCVLDSTEIAAMNQSFCRGGEGDVYKWSDFKRYLRGGVQLIYVWCPV